MAPTLKPSEPIINVYIENCKHIYVVGYVLLSEKAMAPHSSTLAWQIPWTEEPGRLQPMGSLWVGHDWATSLSLFTFMHWRRKWQPTPVFLPGESQGRGSLVAAIDGVAQSRTQLKWLSSSSMSYFQWTSSAQWHTLLFKTDLFLIHLRSFPVSCCIFGSSCFLF